MYIRCQLIPSKNRFMCYVCSVLRYYKDQCCANQMMTTLCPLLLPIHRAVLPFHCTKFFRKIFSSHECDGCNRNINTLRCITCCCNNGDRLQVLTVDVWTPLHGRRMDWTSPGGETHDRGRKQVGYQLPAMLVLV